MVWHNENSVGQPTTTKTVIDTPDLISLKWAPEQHWMANNGKIRQWNLARPATFEMRFQKLFLKVFIWFLQWCGTAENSIGWPTTENNILENRPEMQYLKWDFQNLLWNLSCSNIKKVTDFASLMIWDGQKGNPVNETRPDRQYLKWDFQNRL